MFYTYGDFHSEFDTLEEAQENKANYLLRLLEAKAGHKILDLGCGWGSMMKKIIQDTQDKENIRGYTLSKEQHSYTRELGYNVELQDVMTADFGTARYDRIYSVGILEHIRGSELLPLAKKLKKALRPGGRVVHHFFCQPGELPSPEVIFLLDMFPGSVLASLGRHRRVFEEAGFQIVHHSIHDYRPTLRAWFERLVENKDRAIDLIGVRNYNRHLSYFACSYRLFDEGHLIPNRFALEPTRNQS
jgi:cyclopropane-fatty-acyl-phospholipid synthase